MDAFDRYKSDSEFHTLCETFAASMAEGRFTAGEFRAAVGVALYLTELRRGMTQAGALMAHDALTPVAERSAP